ncbi:MAG: helix-turn-helix transcriptional regulator [Clostridia bacterium]|nr:helix-turn-helix transcriptional regulator [Clostridia bacterium]
MDFKERLKAVRKERKLTQRELADLIKSNNNTVSNWEKGVSRPTTPVVESLARALNISVFSLLGDFTVADIQRLYNQESKRTPEEEMALIFALPLLVEADIHIESIPVDELSLDIKQIESVTQKVCWDTLLGNGGKELLWAYDYLTNKAKTLVLDFVTGLLHVPAYLVLGEEDIDEELINDLNKVKGFLQGGE